MPETIYSEILFIINPYSGRGKNQEIITRLSKLYPEIACKQSSSVDDFQNICRENIHKFTYFIVAGGDGTIHTAVNFFYHFPDKVLGIYPAGSGNGFAYEMGFTRNIEALFNAIMQNKRRAVDVIDLNGEKCINVAGVGLDSYIAHRFSHSKTRGLKSYIRITLKALLTFKAVNARIKTGNLEFTDKYLMISIANTRQFGNHALIAPKANPSDGNYDVVLVKPLPFYLIPLFVFRLFRGTLHDSKYLSYLSTHEPMQIETRMNEFHIDGEPKELNSPVNITIEQGKITILNCC